MTTSAFSSELVHRIQEFLGDQAGLDAKSFHSQCLERALDQRAKLRGLREAATYWNLLRSDPQELRTLVESLVVPETWFLRETEALAALVQECGARRAADRGSSKLRILSAPCATGEEPLSIVMTLMDAGWHPESIEVVAGDISEPNLVRGRSGLYQSNSFRTRDLSFQSQYFEPHGEGFRVHERVMRSIRFANMNLVARGLSTHHAPFDFIFCRNLFIYLRSGARRQVLDNLFSVLKDDGGLFVGAAECGYLSRQLFKAEPVLGSFVFRKQQLPQILRRREVTSSVTPCVASPAITNGLWDATILSDSRSQRHEALVKARELADAGQLDQAAFLCESFLKRESASVDGLYLLGVVRDAEGQTIEAETLYRKALYLDPHCYEALVQLSLNRERVGDRREARMLQERARRLKDREEKLP